MADKTKASGLFDPLAAMSEFHKSGSIPVAWMGGIWAEAMQNCMQEMSRFIALRLEKDVKTQQAMMNCKSPQDFADIQADFLQHAIEDYQAQQGRLSEIVRDFVDKASKPGSK